MPFLLRVSLPDVPASLARVASASGEGGGDAGARESVDRGVGGGAGDDVLLEIGPGATPGSVGSACIALGGVEVLWINRVVAGGNLFLALEVVEELAAQPAQAIARVL